MPVGAQTNRGSVDATMTDLAVSLRNLAQKARNLVTPLTASGLTTEQALAAVGYSETPNAQNPGGVSDAALAAQFISYMSTMTGLYYGTVQQGGTGGTGATPFDFNSALSPLWAGQT